MQTADLQTIALLHIDADWSATVRIVLETLYDKVVEGGFVVLDDCWRWPGCREVVTNYLKEHQTQGGSIAAGGPTRCLLSKTVPMQGRDNR